jgi:hypothetical protein
MNAGPPPSHARAPRTPEPASAAVDSGDSAPRPPSRDKHAGVAAGDGAARF